MMRPTRATDRPFLFELYCETHPTLVATLLRCAPELVAQQHAAREAAWRAMAGRLDDRVVEHDDVAVGRCVVLRGDGFLHVLELAIRPRSQNRGIGSAVLSHVIDEARAAGLPLRLEVEMSNGGALRLYERLGFRRCGTDGPHYQLELPCGGSAACSIRTA